MMNKVFILVLVAFAAIATAQNPPQCSFEKETAVSLARAYQRLARGEVYESPKGTLKYP